MQPTAGPGLHNASEANHAQRDRVRRRLIYRFYLSMLAIAAIDLCFAIIYEVPITRFYPTAVLLVILTLAGSYFIFRPVQRFLRDPESVSVPFRSIASLSYRCTAFIAALIGLLAIAKFVLLPNILDFDIDLLLTRNEQLWLPVLHTLYYTALIFFVMVDYEALLRLRVYVWYGVLVPAARGRLLYRLLVAFTVTSLLPIGLIVLHAVEYDAATERRVLAEDVVATALALVVTLYFITRSLLRPILALERATRSIERNDLSVNVPVLSNDETGHMAQGFNRMVKGLRERALIRETFGRYVPERVAAAILSGEGELAPRSATATILFVDIADFTGIAEHASPDQVVEILNEYFSAVVEPIEENNGVVTQFQGDGLLAMFNLPIPDPDHASSALRAGLMIQRICSERHFSGVAIQVRIGIATGQVTAGNVGSDTRLTYTVHGDAVNLAARLEQLNKDLGTDLLVDEETVQRLRESAPLAFVNEVKVRGRVSSVRVYTGKKDARSPEP
ncbi:MAG TPA: adenylate/guanylate cyclase domain-containing protein [Gammaproteobacteria bacterium]|nr:adenylate/guanylate cyclase domain-containing protein [Gammaproteobacteria bacterium]